MCKFELKQSVRHRISGRTGVIYAKAEYVFGDNNYLVYWDVVPDQWKEAPNDWATESYLEAAQ